MKNSIKLMALALFFCGSMSVESQAVTLTDCYKTCAKKTFFPCLDNCPADEKNAKCVENCPSQLDDRLAACNKADVKK